MDEFKTLYNTKIIILPGGLTPKAQIMDTHNNRPFKCSLKAKLRKMRAAKYNAAKAEAAKDPLHKGQVGVPRFGPGSSGRCNDRSLGRVRSKPWGKRLGCRKANAL